DLDLPFVLFVPFVANLFPYSDAHAGATCWFCRNFPPALAGSVLPYRGASAPSVTSRAQFPRPFWYLLLVSDAGMSRKCYPRCSRVEAPGRRPCDCEPWRSYIGYQTAHHSDSTIYRIAVDAVC